MILEKLKKKPPKNPILSYCSGFKNNGSKIVNQYVKQIFLNNNYYKKYIDTDCQRNNTKAGGM